MKGERNDKFKTQFSNSVMHNRILYYQIYGTVNAM